MPYVLWVAAYNTSFLLGYLALDTAFFHVPEPDKFPYINKSSSARENSPVRNDRGPLVSPTEAAVAAFSQSYSRSNARTAATEFSPPSPSPGNRLKRSPSKRAVYDETNSGTNVETPSYSQLHSDNDAPLAFMILPRRAPDLLEAINKNGLAFFLLVSRCSILFYSFFVHQIRLAISLTSPLTSRRTF